MRANPLLIAAALSLRGGAAAHLRTRLPDDAALRALTPGQLRFALRHRIRDRQITELHRIARSDRSKAPNLDDIGGYGEAEAAARRLVADLADWSAGRIAWGDMTRSLLFVGPPGTGKTWLARAIAGSAGVPLIEGSLAAWQATGHLGDMLRAMRASFAQAQAAAPAVLFLDEIDGAGDRGSDDSHARTYRRQVINALLELLDGAGRTPGLVVLAACNDVVALDPAIRRPGRPGRRAAAAQQSCQDHQSARSRRDARPHPPCSHPHRRISIMVHAEMPMSPDHGWFIRMAR